MRPAWTLGAASVLALLGCDALVGGACADGYQAQDGQCVPEKNNPTSTGGEGGTTTTTSDGGGDEGGGGGGGEGGTGAGGEGGGFTCEPPLTTCADACVDLQTSAFHCGECFNLCETISCIDGSCVGDTAGHVVVLGMSFQNATPATRRLLGNAVFMPSPSHVRVLDWSMHAAPGLVKIVDSIIDDEAAFRGRSWHNKIALSAQNFASELANAPFEVALIRDQVLAPTGHGNDFAHAVSESLSSFTADGGLVVVLATSSSEMPTLLTEAGLLDIAGIVPINGSTIVKNAPTDSLAINVAAPFVAPMQTAALVTTEAASSTLSFVFTDDSAAANPVAVHKVILPAP